MQGHTSTATGSDSTGVLIVLTDEDQIFQRDTVPADEVDAVIERRNRAVAVPELRWRRAITFREPLNTLCGACGTRRCWCGVNRLVHRSEARR